LRRLNDPPATQSCEPANQVLESILWPTSRAFSALGFQQWDSAGTVYADRARRGSSLMPLDPRTSSIQTTVRRTSRASSAFLTATPPTS
jgi:hypothetical protein